MCLGHLFHQLRVQLGLSWEETERNKVQGSRRQRDLAADGLLVGPPHYGDQDLLDGRPAGLAGAIRRLLPEPGMNQPLPRRRKRGIVHPEELQQRLEVAQLMRRHHRRPRHAPAPAGHDLLCHLRHGSKRTNHLCLVDDHPEEVALEQRAVRDQVPLGVPQPPLVLVRVVVDLDLEHVERREHHVCHRQPPCLRHHQLGRVLDRQLARLRERVEVRLADHVVRHPLDLFPGKPREELGHFSPHESDIHVDQIALGPRPLLLLAPVQLVPDAVVHLHLEPRRVVVDLRCPLLQQRRRHDDQRPAAKAIAVRAPSPPVHRLLPFAGQYERQHLDRLAEPHLVAQDSSQRLLLHNRRLREPARVEIKHRVPDRHVADRRVPSCLHTVWVLERRVAFPEQHPRQRTTLIRVQRALKPLWIFAFSRPVHRFDHPEYIVPKCAPLAVRFVGRQINHAFVVAFRVSACVSVVIDQTRRRIPTKNLDKPLELVLQPRALSGRKLERLWRQRQLDPRRPAGMDHHGRIDQTTVQAKLDRCERALIDMQDGPRWCLRCAQALSPRLRQPYAPYLLQLDDVRLCQGKLEPRRMPGVIFVSRSGLVEYQRL